MLSIILSSLIVFSLPSLSITKIEWSDLADIEFSTRYHPEEDLYYKRPTFGDKVKSFEGEEVYISGYIMPIEEGLYVLSKSTYASCFFCGLAGPETVIELEMLYPQDFEMDDKVTIRGYMKLNYDNPYQLQYVLQEAETYK